MKDKLIRANSLLEQIESPYTEYSVMARIRSAIKEMIDEAPEVEAIPIEWIRRWLGASRSSGLSLDAYIMLHDWYGMEKNIWIVDGKKQEINDQQEKNIISEDDANQTKKQVKVVADDVDKCVDTFLKRVYTDLLSSWESTHKDASDNNIIPYEIQEINPDKER